MHAHNGVLIDSSGEIDELYPLTATEDRALTQALLSMEDTEKLVTVVSIGIMMVRLIKEGSFSLEVADALFKYGLEIINTLDEPTTATMNLMKLFPGFEETSSIIYCDWARIRNAWFDVRSFMNEMKKLCVAASFGTSTNHILSYQSVLIHVSIPHGPFRVFDLLFTYSSVLITLCSMRRNEMVNEVILKVTSLFNSRSYEYKVI